MLSIRIDQARLNDLYKRLGAVKAKATLIAPMRRATARLTRDLADYPPPSRAKQPPRTERQRRFLHALARQGGIPYTRTGNLGRAWTDTIEERTDGISGIVGNATPYGPLVQGVGDQADYHQGTWQTDADVVRRNRKAIEDDFSAALDQALR